MTVNDPLRYTDKNSEKQYLIGEFQFDRVWNSTHDNTIDQIGYKSGKPENYRGRVLNDSNQLLDEPNLLIMLFPWTGMCRKT